MSSETKKRKHTFEYTDGQWSNRSKRFAKLKAQEEAEPTEAATYPTASDLALNRAKSRDEAITEADALREKGDIAQQSRIRWAKVQSILMKEVRSFDDVHISSVSIIGIPLDVKPFIELERMFLLTTLGVGMTQTYSFDEITLYWLHDDAISKSEKRTVRLDPDTLEVISVKVGRCCAH